MALLLTACSGGNKPAESTDKTADETSDTKQSQDKSTDKGRCGGIQCAASLCFSGDGGRPCRDRLEG